MLPRSFSENCCYYRLACWVTRDTHSPIILTVSVNSQSTARQTVRPPRPARPQLTFQLTTGTWASPDDDINLAQISRTAQLPHKWLWFQPLGFEVVMQHQLADEAIRKMTRSEGFISQTQYPKACQFLNIRNELKSLQIFCC